MAMGDGHTQSEQKWELVQCASTGQSSSFGGLVNNKAVHLDLNLKPIANHSFECYYIVIIWAFHKLEQQWYSLCQTLFKSLQGLCFSMICIPELQSEK